MSFPGHEMSRNVIKWWLMSDEACRLG